MSKVKENLTFIDFIGIGAEKAGTTWLYDQLNQHPEINFARKKELHFFNKKDCHNFDVINENFEILGYQWYEKQFPKSEKGKVRGEISPGYLFCNEAVKRIYHYNKDIKLICCIRNPIERAISQYYHDIRIGVADINIPFDRAIKIKQDYIEKGLYFRHIKAYLKLFPKKQIHIILFDDIKENPKAVLKKTCEFLGIAQIDFHYTNKRSNVGGQAKFPRLNKWIYTTKYFVRKNSILKKMLPIINYLGISDLILKITNVKTGDGYKVQSISEESKNILRKKYKDDINQLEKLLGRDLSHWK